MNQSEKPKFEQDWQRAFESAAESPPPAAWHAIEARLDAQETAVVPLLWWKNPKVWYAAAAVVALLLVSWPILESYRTDDPATRLAAGRTTSPGPSGAMELPGKATPDPGVYTSDGNASSGTKSKANERTAQAEEAGEAFFPPAASGVNEPSERVAVGESRQPIFPPSQKNLAIEENSASTFTDSPSLSQTPKDTKVSEIETKFNQSRGLLDATPNALVPHTPTVIVITQSTRKIPVGADASEELNRVIKGSSTVPLRTKALTQPIAALSAVDGLTQVNVDFREPAIKSDLEIFKAAHPRRSRVRELWAGLSLMPALFNPRTNVTSAPRAFASANASRQSLSNASQARLSYAVQAQAGKQLSKRWSVETGVSYLRGNSTFASDGYVLDAVTSRSANVLEDALHSNSLNYNSFKNSASPQNLDLSAGSYIDFDQRTTNDFRYVQVPVQAGYTLNPDGRLNYTVLGGVVANLFLQNQIENREGYVSVNTADDGLYRALNWSATTGVRVNYRLSDHWNATLTGSYQKAIASILKGDGVLDARPQLYGVAWGVRYVF